MSNLIEEAGVVKWKKAADYSTLREDFEVFYAGFDYGFNSSASGGAGEVSEAEEAYRKWKKTGDLG